MNTESRLSARIAVIGLLVCLLFSTPTAHAQITINPPAVAFDGTPPGVPVFGSFTLTNSSSRTYHPVVVLDDPAGVFVLRADADHAAILPGQSVDFDLNFVPQELGTYSGAVVLGDGLPLVPLSGTCTHNALDFALDPPPYFEYDNVYEHMTRSLLVTNTGLVTLQVQPRCLDPIVQSLSPAEVVTLAPGDTVTIGMTIAIYEYGQFTVPIILDSVHDVVFNVVAAPHFEFGADENRMGFFFDEELTTNRETITPAPQRVRAYLAMFNPSNHSGVAGWECRIEPSAGAILSGYDLEGHFIDANAGQHEFTVGVGLEPVPYASVILLGTFEFDVWNMAVEEVAITAGPVAVPTIPGLMAWVPWDHPEVLIPLLPITGKTELAWVDWSDPVALEAPSPICTVQDGSVLVVWPNRAPVGGGYHVYRRRGAGQLERLTEVLLESERAIINYRDQDLGDGAGGELRYSYALVVAGLETARSPEADAQLPDVPLRATRLIQNVPNPFNPETAIAYEVAARGQVRLGVFDITGRRVRVLVDAVREAGVYAPVWDGRGEDGRMMASGAYYIRLETDRMTDCLKVMLVK
ncbi:MAG: FlgD immunoglobulin-like domain containing protein [Candidatus Krumholzibacteria bacterium]|nr:FlgD immunoglobulin-like domain containing protein [Candidatus Krumholzibacteria bacterium]